MRIDHVTVIDPRDGGRRTDVSIQMQNGAITSVIDEPAPGPQGWAIDGGGRFVVPGYINMHTHVLQSERPELPLAVMLSEGTTGMRQMAGSADLLDARTRSQQGLPRYAPELLEMPGSLLMPFTASSVEDVRALRVVKGSLRHVDGTFVVHDHLFEEQTAGLGGVCVLQQGHVFFGHHAVVTAH